MWGTSTLHALCHLVCFEVDTVITPILQMRRVKFQEVSVCARSLQPAKGCQGLSNFNRLSASSPLCYIMLDSPLTPRIAQLISASLPFHPSQELPTFPGPFQVVPSLLSSPFPLQPSLLISVPELLWYLRMCRTQNHLRLYSGCAVWL